MHPAKFSCKEWGTVHYALPRINYWVQKSTLHQLRTIMAPLHHFRLTWKKRAILEKWSRLSIISRSVSLKEFFSWALWAWNWNPNLAKGMSIEDWDNAILPNRKHIHNNEIRKKERRSSMNKSKTLWKIELMRETIRNFFCRAVWQRMNPGEWSP